MSKSRLFVPLLCLRKLAKVCALAGPIVLAGGQAGFAQIGSGAVQSLEENCKVGSTYGTCYVWLSDLQPSGITAKDIQTLKSDLTASGFSATSWPVSQAKSYVLSSSNYT